MTFRQDRVQEQVEADRAVRPVSQRAVCSTLSETLTGRNGSTAPSITHEDEALGVRDIFQVLQTRSSTIRLSGDGTSGAAGCCAASGFTALGKLVIRQNIH